MKKLKLIKRCKTLVLLMLISLCSATLYAQTTTVKGKVVDEKGEPVIGATVKLKSRPVGTVTDISGNFSLNVPAGETTLVVSYLGYVTQQIPVSKSSNNLLVTLVASANNLNEVVVVGYGTLKRADVTGTVASVDAKTLQEIPASNVFDQLKGRVAGVDVVESTNGPLITIRGNRTIGAAPGVDGPLIVLDGQPYYNSIENINPNDIKSIDILKGASATAIYGSRASGGVLLITSNRGRVGQTVTSFDSYEGISTLEGSLKLLNGKQFAQLELDASQGGLLQSGVTGNLYALSGNETKALNAGISTNYPSLLLKNGMVLNQNLRVSGGTDRTQFNVGTGYYLNTGLEPNNSTKRISLNANI